MGEAVAAEVVTTAARRGISRRIAATAGREERVTRVVILVTWLGIVFRNLAVNVEEDVVVVVTSVVTLVTWLGIALRSLLVSV